MIEPGRTVLSLTLSLAALAAGGEAAARAKPAYMPVGSAADAPQGFVDMCARDQALCRLGAAPEPVPAAAKFELVGGMIGATGAIALPPTVAARQAEAAALSPAQPDAVPAAGRITDEKLLRRLARRINSQVNRSVVQIPDMVATGIGEQWRRPGIGDERFGDCEDLAIEKRAALTDAGFPAERMFYAVSFVRGYGLHTVLVARLNDGDYVLDSMAARMQRWSAGRQIWLRRQMPGDPLNWVRLDGADTGPTAGLAAAGAQPGLNPS